MKYNYARISSPVRMGARCYYFFYIRVKCVCMREWVQQVKCEHHLSSLFRKILSFVLFFSLFHWLLETAMYVMNWIDPPSLALASGSYEKTDDMMAWVQTMILIIANHPGVPRPAQTYIYFFVSFVFLWFLHPWKHALCHSHRVPRLIAST